MKMPDEMKADHKLQFIFIWRLNDWGLYNRRHEAFARDIAKRDSVERVLHIEHISIKGIIYLMLRWLQEKNSALKKIYAGQIKKGVSLWPVAVDKSNKLFVYSVVLVYVGRSAVFVGINDFVKRQQYKMLNRFIKHSSGRKILFAYPPSIFMPDAIEAINHDVLIADLVDDDISRTEDMAKKKELVDNYKKILPNCNWIFATSPSFNMSEYRDYAQREIDYLPNGVDCGDHIETLQKAHDKKNDRKTIAYIGILNKEVDMELLEFIIRNNTEVNFMLIGWATDECLKDINMLTAEYDNLAYLGPKGHYEAAEIMRKCDVLINIKNNDRTTAGADAIKIYEYLATGKPIVATPMPPADRFAELIYVTSDKFQYSQYIRDALRENDSDMRRKRIEVARRNTWHNRVDVILERVLELL